MLANSTLIINLMGQIGSSMALKSNEIIEFAKASNLTNTQVCLIHSYYKHFCKIHKDDGVIDYQEFCTMLQTQSCNCIHAIFKAFDTNGDSHINFREFLLGIANTMHEPKSKQIDMLFSILDNKSAGHICQSSIEEAILGWSAICPEIKIPKDVIHSIIDNTYKLLPNDKPQLDYVEFNKLVMNCNLPHMSFDDEKASYSLKKLKTKRSKSMVCGFNG